MESLSREVHTVKSVMEGKVSRLQTNLAAMLEKMQALEKGRSNIVLTPPPLVACDSKTVESNKQYLATLDYMQVGGCSLARSPCQCFIQRRGKSPPPFSPLKKSWQLY